MNRVFIICMVMCLAGSSLGQEKAKSVLPILGQQVPSEKVNPSATFATGFLESIYLSDRYAAKTGQYLAQDQDELQTYYDLGLDYQFIEQEDYRSQMNLPKGQGIMIKKSQADTTGYELGFRKGDIVMTVADKPVDNQYKFVIAMKENRGKTFEVKVRRAGNDNSWNVTMPPLEKKKAEKTWILGVNVEPVDDILKKHIQSGGLLIVGLVDKSPAQKMGLRKHDVIVNLNSQKIESLDDLRRELKKSKGAKVSVGLIREGNNLIVELTPMEKKESANDAIHSMRFWDLTESGGGTFEFAPVDFDQDGSLDLYLMPKSSESTKKKSEKGVTLDGLAKKIDEIKKQIDELKAAKQK